MPYLVPMLVALAHGCTTAVQDTTLQIRLRSTLGVGADAAISVDTLTSRSWPGAVFFRARRVPPFPHGEDPRPAVVSGIVRGADTLIAYSWEHLSRVWAVLDRPPSRNPDSTGASLLELLDLTSIAPRSRVLKSPADARATDPGWALSIPFALQEVRAPSTQRFGPGTVVSLYTRETGGVFLTRVLITDGGMLEYDRKQIAATALTH
jgi:hypothetical protein